jgi:ubiquitin
MSEETKSEVVSAPAKRAQTFAQDVAMWTEKAPLCKCKLEKVIYICQD